MSALGWLAFVVAAGVGAPARYLVDRAVQRRCGDRFPWGTFAVNVTGCLGAGALAALGHHHGLGSTAATVVGVGGLGAYSTFSTVSFETVRLVEEGCMRAAAANAVGSAVAGAVAAAAAFGLVAAL